MYQVSLNRDQTSFAFLVCNVNVILLISSAHMHIYMNFASTTCLLFFNAINGRLTQRASKSHLYSFEPDDERMRRNRKSKTPRARAPAEIRLSVSTFQPQEHYEAIFRQRAGNPQSNYFHTLMSIQHWTLRPRPSACCA
jgi:hypothetical protein